MGLGSWALVLWPWFLGLGPRFSVVRDWGPRTETEADASRRHTHLTTGHLTRVIRRHQLDRPRAQVSLPIQLSAVQTSSGLAVIADPACATNPQARGPLPQTRSDASSGSSDDARIVGGGPGGSRSRAPGPRIREKASKVTADMVLQRFRMCKYVPLWVIPCRYSGCDTCGSDRR